MNRKSLKSVTSLLLAALLAAVAIAPPVQCHVHALEGGAAAGHRHDAAKVNAPVHEHDGHGAGHVHASSSAAPPHQIAGLSWHLHFQLLRWDFTIPDAAPEDNGGREGQQDQQLMALLRGNGPFDGQPQGPSLADQLEPQLVRSTLGDAAPMQTVTSPPPPVSSPPLSDRARHERSGVLLA